MPLSHGKSKKAFEKNIKTEMEHGKPQKQALAIAFAMKRKHPKKMAEGGLPISNASGISQGISAGFGDTKNPPPVPKYAKGGYLEDDEMYSHAKNKTFDVTNKFSGSAKPHAHGGQIEYSKADPNQDMVDMHSETDPAEDALVNRIMDKVSKNYSGLARLAMGGEVDGPSFEDGEELSLIDRIMHKHSDDESELDRYSEGGRVANQEHGENNNSLAGFDDNEFDDLVLRDDLESSYGDDDNAGDDIGNKQEDEDRHDIIARILSSQKKKDKLPRPA